MMTLSSLLQHVADASYRTYSRATTNGGDGESTPESAILLISFNIASAALLMATVIFDAWKLSKKHNLLQIEKRQSLLELIRPGEVVTLSFTIAVLIQGLILVIIQSMQMGALTSSNCRSLGQVLFPTLWIVGLVILVFGIENLYRAFKRNRFAPRGKKSVYICWVAVVLLTLLLWIPTQTRRSTLVNCSFGLLSTVTSLSDVAFGVTVAFIVSYTLIASVLATQLYRTSEMNPVERIAASQMVYYLGIATAIFAFFLPFWARLTLDMPEGVTPMMAMVSINVIGITVSFFQLLFRSYTDCMTIHSSSSVRDFRDWKLLSPWGTGIKNKISAPIAIPQYEIPSFDNMHKGVHTPGSIVKGMNMDKSLPPTPTIRQKSKDNAYNATHYSIFPAKPADTRQPKYPASSIYENDMFLAPPRPPFAAHNRNSSDVSHATVQIGLRLSNLEPPPGNSASKSGQAPSPLSPRPYSRFLRPQNDWNHMSTTSLDVPVTLRSPATERPFEADMLPTTLPFGLGSRTLPSSSSEALIATTSTQVSTIPEARTPTVYQRLGDLQKLLEVDLKAAQQASPPSVAQNDKSWPLRDSQPVTLTQKTYRPDDNDQD